MVDADVHARRVEHLERGHEGRLGERMGVAAHEERAADPVRLAEGDDRGCRGDDVGFVERPGQRRAPVAGRAERHQLRSDARIGQAFVVGADEGVDVHERREVGRPAGTFADDHRCSYAAGRV